MKPLRMIEFFSGIGGMRLAVEGALPPPQQERRTVQIVQAYDISLHANRTYLHNFPHEKVSTKLIEQLKAKDLDGVADIWTMSPPCQPFTTTKGAKGLDEEDKRCNGFKHIIQLLTLIESKPQWIMLENVKGFATSRMIQKWKQCLTQNGYTFREYCVSPVQVGIPNHRLRYYMMCEHSDRWKNQPEGVMDHPPPYSREEFPTRTVAEYVLQSGDANRPAVVEDIAPFLIPDSILEKPWAAHLGVVSGGDTATHCFTASYGRILHKASGSLYLMEQEEGITGGAVALADQPLDRTDMLQYSTRLRRFLPKELLRLFGFPATFSFPDDIPLEHHYKLIGNSINVTLVSLLAKELLCLGFEGDKEDVTKIRCGVDTSRLQVGGEKGHIVEEIDGRLLQLYQALRWKGIPNCTGRYTCRDHSVTSLDPRALLSKYDIPIVPPPCASSWDKMTDTTDTSTRTEDGTMLSPGQIPTIRLPDRADSIMVVPLDSNWTVGLITFVKDGSNGTNRIVTEDVRMQQEKESKNISAATTVQQTRRTYVHTLNTPSGFRRKLLAMGLSILEPSAAKDNEESMDIHHDFRLVVNDKKLQKKNG